MKECKARKVFERNKTRENKTKSPKPDDEEILSFDNQTIMLMVHP
jgi:hypothetical protein